MKADILRDIMVRNHISNNDLSTLIDKSPRQISNYLSGAQAIPRAEAIMFKAIDEGKFDLDWLLEKVVEEIKDNREVEA